MNKILYLTELDQFLEWWPFLLEGLKVLNDPKGGRGNMTQDRYFKTLLRVVSSPAGEGALMVLTSKSDKPLAYVVLVNNTAPFDNRSALCFALYSNNQCPTATRELHKEVNKWCRENQYKKLYAASKRVNGSAVRLFEKKWGFRMDSIVFSKEI